MTTCARCHRAEAETSRRIPTYIGTWGTVEPVCRGCADLLDNLAETLARGCAQVDRACRRQAPKPFYGPRQVWEVLRAA